MTMPGMMKRIDHRRTKIQIRILSTSAEVKLRNPSNSCSRRGATPRAVVSVRVAKPSSMAPPNRMPANPPTRKMVMAPHAPMISDRISVQSAIVPQLPRRCSHAACRKSLANIFRFSPFFVE